MKRLRWIDRLQTRPAIVVAGGALAIGLSASVLTLPSHAESTQDHPRRSTPERDRTTNRMDIVDTAAQTGQFNTLLAAAEAAGMVRALRGPGPLTVFAPTDEAFDKLPEGTVDSLLNPANRDQLQAILSFHVVPAQLLAADVVRSSGAKTLNGQALQFETNQRGATVSGAQIVRTDINCRNGVIHVIDAVILPSSDDIVATAQSAGQFNTLIAAAKAAGLVEALQGDGPLTVFAPTDEAFARLPEGTVESLLEPANRDTLAAILKYHVVSGRIFATDAVNAGRATTLQGDDVLVSIRNGRLMINNASVIGTDINASNGVVHVIDRVILPPGM